MKKIMVSCLALLLAVLLVVPGLATFDFGTEPDDATLGEDVMPSATAPASESTEPIPYEEPTTDFHNNTNGFWTAAQFEHKFQEGAESVQVGNYLIQADSYLGNVRLTNLTNGQVFNTLPALFVEGVERVVEAQARQELFSDISGKFYYNPVSANDELDENSAGGSVGDGWTADVTAPFYSYTDTVCKDQLKVTKLSNGFHLEYGIGDVITPIAPLVFSEEDWLYWIDKIQDAGIREEMTMKYERVDFKESREQLRYWRDESNKHRGDEDIADVYKTWVTRVNLGRSYASLQRLYDAGDNGVYYIWYGHNDGNFTIDLMNRFGAEWEKVMTMEDYDAVCEHTGGFSNPYYSGGFTVGVEITVDENGVLTYSLKADEYDTPAGLYIINLSCARFLNATMTEEEGYLIVPSGSGAIIDNNTVGTPFTKAEYNVFGEDNAASQKAGIPFRQPTVLPIYGSVRDGVGVSTFIESGASHCKVTAELGIMLGSHRMNLLYPNFDVTLFDQVRVSGRSAGTDQPYQLFPRRVIDGKAYGLLPQVDFTMTYHMSYGDQANYAQTAKLYRDKLLAEGMQKTVKAGSSIPMMLDIYGCIIKKQLYLGVPIDTHYALTKFEQAQEILEYLTEECGVKDFSVRYLGWMNGGLAPTAPTKIRVQRQLGGVKGFKAFEEYMSEKDYQLYPDVNLVTVYKDEMFDGFSPNKMTSKRIDFVYAILNGTDLVTGLTVPALSARYVISPRFYDTVYTAFTKELDKKLPELKSLAFSETGKSLSSDFTLNKYVYHSDSIPMIKEFLDSYEKNGFDLATESGNEYTLPYVQSVFRLPDTSSRLLLETREIPLVQMVLHGSINYCGESLNERQNDSKYILKCLEIGELPYARLMYALDKDLKETVLTDSFSLCYNDWTDSIKRIYGEVNPILSKLQTKAIIGHEQLDEEVFMTTYEGGTQIVVNYGKYAYDYNGQKVGALGYLVIG